MTHQFLVTADLSSAEDVDFTLNMLKLGVPGPVKVKYLGYNQLEPLTRALAQVAVARESENQDRLLNALTFALNTACGLVPGMYTP